MRGKSYVGVSQGPSGSTTHVTRPAKQMQGLCSCKVSSNCCKHFSNLDRKLIFDSFWKMSWQRKTKFVANNTQKTSYEKESGATS